MRRKNEFIYFDDREVLECLQAKGEKSNLLPSISIACSPRCNLKCPHCIYDAKKRKTEGLSAEDKMDLLEQAHDLGARFLQICHEGEPFLGKIVPMLIEKATELGIKTLIYTNATLITPKIAKFLYDNEVCLGVKLDSLNPDTFNIMLGEDKAKDIYTGIQNLIEAGYNKPFARNGKLYTRLSLVCTLTSINTSNIEEIKDVARFAWNNNLFFGAARLEQGGRAVGQVWKEYKIPDKQKIIDFIDWCSKQTGIDYWNAQPTPYCIGACGLQIADNGDVWVTEYGGSCDFTEPDGESFPNHIFTVDNVKEVFLEKILDKVWEYRKKMFLNGTLARKLAEYEATKDIYPNGLQDCGSARTYTLFLPFYKYIKHIIEQEDFASTISSDLINKAGVSC